MPIVGEQIVCLKAADTHTHTEGTDSEIVGAGAVLRKTAALDSEKVGWVEPGAVAKVIHVQYVRDELRKSVGSPRAWERLGSVVRMCIAYEDGKLAWTSLRTKEGRYLWYRANSHLGKFLYWLGVAGILVGLLYPMAVYTYLYKGSELHWDKEGVGANIIFQTHFSEVTNSTANHTEYTCAPDLVVSWCNVTSNPNQMFNYTQAAQLVAKKMNQIDCATNETEATAVAADLLMMKCSHAAEFLHFGIAFAGIYMMIVGIILVAVTSKNGNLTQTSQGASDVSANTAALLYALLPTLRVRCEPGEGRA